VADRTLNARLRFTGASQVKAAIEGTAAKAREAQRTTRTATQRAQREMVADVRRAEREKQAALKKTAAEATKAERARAVAAKRAIDTIAREQRKAEMARRREFDRTAREQERRDRRTGQMAERGLVGGGLGGAVAGASLAAGVVAALQQGFAAFVQQQAALRQAVGAHAGVQDIGERTVSAQDFNLNLARSQGEFFQGQSFEEQGRSAAALREEILGVAQATNVEPGQLLDALALMQEEFSAFDFGRDNLRALADESKRTGASMEELARFAGTVRQQLGDIDVDKILDITAQGGLQGALSPEALAGEFAGQFGVFRQVVDPNQTADAETLYRQFVAQANVVRSSGLNTAESATANRALIGAISDPNVQARLAAASGGTLSHRRVRGVQTYSARGGVQLGNYRDASGQLDLTGYYEALADSGITAEDLGRVEGLPQTAVTALGAIIARRRDEQRGVADNADMRELQGVSVEAGGAFRARGLQAVHATGAYAAQTEAIRGMDEGIRGERGRSAEAVGGLGIAESMRHRGRLGQWLAESDTAVSAAQALQGSFWEGNGQRPTGPDLIGATGHEGVISGALLEERRRREAAGNIKGADNATAQLTGMKADVAAGVREALREGPLDVRVVSGGATPVVETPTRTQSPRERGR
jgi:hypothetical protein